MDKKLITFVIAAEYSGCNVSPILEQIDKGRLSSYRIQIFKVESPPPNDVWKKLYYAWDYYKHLAKSKLIVTTQGLTKLRRKTIHLELWHGFATKKGGLMGRRMKDPANRPDIVCCYSNFDAVLKNARLGLTIDNYVVTGAPRNDYLFAEDGHRNLEKLFRTKFNDEKKVLFAPTFRIGYGLIEGKRSFENIFDFENFDVKKFHSFLDSNRVLLFIKPHPVEEKLFRAKIRTFETDRIRIIDSEVLQKEKLDLYKLLNGFDLLITDYSSIYFDWLLLNKPVIFVPVDMKEYWEKRGGWLLEPYDFWAAGPKCTDQESLQREIIKCLEDPSYYEDRRKTVQSIVHHYKDSHSTERVIQLIERVMREEG